jgi:hypothetical protein
MLRGWLDVVVGCKNLELDDAFASRKDAPRKPHVDEVNLSNFPKQSKPLHHLSLKDFDKCEARGEQKTLISNGFHQMVSCFDDQSGPLPVNSIRGLRLFLTCRPDFEARRILYHSLTYLDSSACLFD